jgi:hypothetical protein
MIQLKDKLKNIVQVSRPEQMPFDIAENYRKKGIFSIIRGKRFFQPPNTGRKLVFSPFFPYLAISFWGSPVFLRGY